ncbi:unnamed protein product [Sphagnum troendelagicum]
MEDRVARTTEEEMKVLISFFRIFRPNELAFLLEVNSRWSPFDPDRIEQFSSILSKTFGSYFSPIDIRLAVDYFHREASLVFSVACRHVDTKFSSQPAVFVYPNYVREGHCDVFTSTSLNSGEFVYLGGRQVFERALIESYTCQLLGSAHSWEKAVDAWNLEAFNSGIDISKRGNWQKRLSEAVLKYKTVQFDLCVGTPNVVVPKDVTGFDQWAWNEFPRLLSAFVYLWSNHKMLIGSCGTKCSRCVVIDGHQKCRRRICRAKQVQVDTEEFQSLTIGCCRTPLRGSHYCLLHQEQHSSLDTPRTAAEKKKQGERKHLQEKIRLKMGKRDGFGATNCRTRKDRPEDYIRRCSRSFGIIAAVTNCKIIVSFSEIFRSETLREIISLLCSTIRG